MALLSENFMQSVGNTPLVKLNRIAKDLDAVIAVKLEYFNPTGSVKDRAALYIVKEAEERGDLIPGKSVIIEGTSGNTGIALAAVAAVKGYKCIIVMPSSSSIERRAVLSAFGALLVLTDPAEGQVGVQERVDRLAEIIPNSFKSNQFSNPSNVTAHYSTTGPEIWEQSGGKVDLVVFGVGTGGTLTGTSRFLREKKPSIGVYGVEPYESSILNGFPRGPHKIQGMGASIIPEILDRGIIDEVIRVKSDDAIAMARRLALEEGIMGGITSGANLCAAIELAKRPENKGKMIVTSVNSFGERYLSTELYEDVRQAVTDFTHEDLETSQAAVKQFLGI